MDKQTHISVDEKRQERNGISLEELQHLAECDFCIEQFADYIEQQEFLKAPRYLKDDILASSRKFEIQLVAKSNQASKQLELFYYTLKVGFAAVFAIAFLVLAPSLTGPAFHAAMTSRPVSQTPEGKDHFSLYDGMEKITDRLSRFTYQIYKDHMEVSSDDK